jgi:hypothetical protein
VPLKLIQILFITTAWLSWNRKSTWLNHSDITEIPCPITSHDMSRYLYMLKCDKKHVQSGFYSRALSLFVSRLDATAINWFSWISVLFSIQEIIRFEELSFCHIAVEFFLGTSQFADGFVQVKYREIPYFFNNRNLQQRGYLTCSSVNFLRKSVVFAKYNDELRSARCRLQNAKQQKWRNVLWGVQMSSLTPPLVVYRGAAQRGNVAAQRARQRSCRLILEF